MKPEAFLDQWSICSCTERGDRGQHLHGFVRGRHPKLGECPPQFQDTAPGILTTSTIVAIDLVAGYAETRNTIYCLGERKSKPYGIEVLDVA